MRPANGVILAALLASLPALGQQSSAPLSPPPLPPSENEPSSGTDEATSGAPRSGTADSASPRVRDRLRPSVSSSSFAARAGGELLGGALGEAALGALGSYVGYALVPNTGGLVPKYAGASLGFVVGALLGAGAGTSIGGTMAGGRANFLAALGGSAVGTLGLVFLRTLGGGSVPLSAIALLMPVLGAAAAYELSQPPQPRQESVSARTSTPPVRWFAMAGMLPDGRLSYGISGIF